ncbi:hypothetical protein IAQ61_006318, partial [Plenodomus lingam]|uniref:uncharacterized protein n=1 Tax=Leptosphaeria maculans TaxID=5022 RepID=UPI00331E64F6
IEHYHGNSCGDILGKSLLYSHPPSCNISLHIPLNTRRFTSVLLCRVAVRAIYSSYHYVHSSWLLGMESLLQLALPRSLIAQGEEWHAGFRSYLHSAWCIASRQSREEYIVERQRRCAFLGSDYVAVRYVRH